MMNHVGASSRRRLGVVAAPLVLLAVGCSHEQTTAAATEPPAANVVTVQRGSISHTLRLAGQFQPYQEVEVHAKVSGYIRKINVDIGDKVRAGEVLATLEVPELTAQLKGAVMSTARSKDEITRAQNEVSRAESSHAALHANYTRLKQAAASQPGLIAEQELDDARARDLAAEAQVDAAKSALSAAQQAAGMAGADQERVGAMESYTRVTAPLSGVIVWRYADTGALIQAGTASDTQSLPIVKLSQSDLLRLRLPVPESDVSYIHIGAPVTVRVDALNRSITGTVVRFTREVSMQTRTMETEIDVPNKDLSIDPGMYANAALELEHRENILTLPDEAVIRNGTQPSVLVLDDQNRVQSRAVTLGIASGSLVQIASGLKQGDRVINGGQSKYQPGEKVTPHPENVPPNDQSKQDGSEASGGQH